MKKSGRAGGHIMGMLRPAKGSVPMAELWTEHCTMPLTGRHLHSKRREGAPLSYRWRPKYCGMDASVISQCIRWRRGAVAKRMASDLRMREYLLKEALGKNARPSIARQGMPTCPKEGPLTSASDAIATVPD
jgi:hypothetical protein